jgi:hypothetical protein
LRTKRTGMSRRARWRATRKKQAEEAVDGEAEG